MRYLVLAMVALLGGCAMTTGGASTVEGLQLQSITYSTGPCFGACPVYSVTVGRDGHGTFEGKRFTAVTGARDFTLTEAQFEQFMRALAPYRPTSGEEIHRPGTDCGQNITDQPSADVVWKQGNGSTQHLYLYYGCDRARFGAMVEGLRQAPSALPIQDFINQR